MNIWKSGIMGVVVGDALSCPAQFESREEFARHPVTGMRSFGTFNVPAFQELKHALIEIFDFLRHGPGWGL